MAINTGLLVPLYVDPPSSTWDQYIALKGQHPRVSMICIANPSDGPGTAQQSTYVTGISQLKAAGITVVGYVWTAYGKRPQANVITDINAWSSWYKSAGCSGIFVDNYCAKQSWYQGANHADYLTYYQGIQSACVNTGLSLTIGNPGNPITDSDLYSICTFYVEYETTGMPTSIRQRSAYIALGVPSMPPSSTLLGGVASYCFITSYDVPANPYYYPPPYAAQEVAALDSH